MKRIPVALALISILLGAPAFAADMAAKALPAMPMAAAPNWTGLYVGLTAGGGWGNSRQYDPLGNSSSRYRVGGALGGVELGYNWQINQIVLGAEADFSWADISGAGFTTPTWGCGGQGCQTSVNWLATQRGRIGYLLTSSLMAYGTGGVAEASVGNSLPPCPGPGLGGCADTAHTRTAWTAGAGLEYQFSSHVSAKVEYLFVNFGQFQWTTFLGGTDPGLTYVHDLNIVRAGLNYKF